MDASGWISLKATKDRFHRVVVTVYRQLQDAKEKLVTTNLCVVEAAKHIQRELGHHIAVTFLTDILAFDKAKLINYIRVDEELERQAVEFFKRHSDKEWDIVDCTSFVVMRRLGITKALSVDAHFAQAGFQVLVEL
jgi:predicted nucleic acid-binding protein